MGVRHRPDSIRALREKITLEKLAEQLAMADETAIALYEASLEQEEINVAQDEALIELYEMIGG